MARTPHTATALSVALALSAVVMFHPASPPGRRHRNQRERDITELIHPPELGSGNVRHPSLVRVGEMPR